MKAFNFNQNCHLEVCVLKKGIFFLSLLRVVGMLPYFTTV
jgi:hypothetical protein